MEQNAEVSIDRVLMPVVRRGTITNTLPQSEASLTIQFAARRRSVMVQALKKVHDAPSMAETAEPQEVCTAGVVSGPLASGDSILPTMS